MCLKIRNRGDRRAQHKSTISIVQTLLQRELFAFSSRTVADLFRLDKFQTSRLLQRLERDGLIARVERGKYILLGLSPEQALSNPLYLGSCLAAPAYVSFWSALHFHGFTEQAPRTVFLAITRRKNKVVFRDIHFKFVTIKPASFFGYRREMLAGLPVLVADEAKAIVDSLSLPQYAGGVAETAKALRNAIAGQSVDIPTLVEYARRMVNHSLSSRLGYLLEMLGQSTGGLDAARGPLRLDPRQPAQGTFNARWRVYINVSQQDLFPEGVV